jgi:signal transduction histidine kinase
MRLPKILFSFRTRLLIVLAALLVATLGVQYYLNLREQQLHATIIAEQEQALAASFALALKSVTSREYMFQIDERSPRPFLEEQRGRVINVLVVDEEGNVDDSLDREFLPQQQDNGKTVYKNIRDVVLPELVDVGQITADLRRRTPSSPVAERPLAGERRAVPITVETDEGLNYIIVVLGAAEQAWRQSWLENARPYLPTLGVLLLATMAATILVWRFTRPIQELSHATQRVASGDFSIRVPATDRRDEVGRLALTFNEMVARLGRMRELEAQVKQAEQSAIIGRLASAIAHEIRNPLNYINLTLDHLRTSLSPDDPQKRETVNRLTAQLKTEVQRINTRITEFLKYTRPARLELEPLDLRETVADALRMVEVQAAEVGVETRLEEEGEPPRVLGDRESLRSVFTNLIINGMQAMEGSGGGNLTVRLSTADGHARVRIADTGDGIAPEHLPNIFEPYFSTKETGTGLGLAIVKKAVDDHNGRIKVESEQGAGTAFTVELPLAERG